MKQKIQNVGKFLRWTPWQVKLSMLVMGLGQLCYGQIVKGLFYLAWPVREYMDLSTLHHADGHGYSFQHRHKPL